MAVQQGGGNIVILMTESQIKQQAFIQDMGAVLVKHDKDTESGMLEETLALFLDGCLRALIEGTTGDNHFLNRGPGRA